MSKPLVICSAITEGKCNGIAGDICTVQCHHSIPHTCNIYTEKVESCDSCNKTRGVFCICKPEGINEEFL